jgi:hypothetical protein
VVELGIRMIRNYNHNCWREKGGRQLHIKPLGLQIGFDKVPAPKQKALYPKKFQSKKTLYKPSPGCLLKRYFVQTIPLTGKKAKSQRMCAACKM